MSITSIYTLSAGETISELERDAALSNYGKWRFEKRKHGDHCGVDNSPYREKTLGKMLLN